jgi:hypothetical protein
MKYLKALYKAMIKNREQQVIAYRQGHRYYY